MLSFVFQNADIKNKINSIYLFGSAVRGELSSTSDIDLFVDCKKENEARVRQLMESGIVRFQGSNDYPKWKLLHFIYPFSVQAGDINEWDLKLSIASEGILLYSIKSFINIGERKVLFKITFPKEKKDYIKLRRILFGRDEEDYRGKGIVAEINGKKISSEVFIIPKEEQSRIIELLTAQKIDFTMTEIVEIGG